LLVAAMQQIADWLKNLGMSEYAECFAENRIDLSVLPDLTDQHLEKLGVALGDRLKILRANREFSGATVAATRSSNTARARGARQCRASAAHCHVLRSRWLHVA
jgi:SAM domain (Sterile alpha motif)